MIKMKKKVKITTKMKMWMIQIGIMIKTINLKRRNKTVVDQAVNNNKSKSNPKSSLKRILITMIAIGMMKQTSKSKPITPNHQGEDEIRRVTTRISSNQINKNKKDGMNLLNNKNNSLTLIRFQEEAIVDREDKMEREINAIIMDIEVEEEGMEDKGITITI